MENQGIAGTGFPTLVPPLPPVTIVLTVIVPCVRVRVDVSKSCHLSQSLPAVGEASEPAPERQT